MNGFACRYAIVQFMPYPETGEFANVGVVLMCPQTGHFGYQLQRRKYARVTRFFDELPRHVYRHAMDLIDSELRRVREIIARVPDREREAYLRQVFDNLLHPREAIVRFSAPRIVLTQDPAAELTHQFDLYVDRAFATPEYIEHTIECRIRALLGRLPLIEPFKAGKVGDDEIYAKFPLVQYKGNKPAKIIKPLNLAQREPMGIYDHGDVWLQKLRRLQNRNLLPGRVLFAVAGPPPSDAKRYAAYAEICRELVEIHVQAVDGAADDPIEQFALN